MSVPVNMSDATKKYRLNYVNSGREMSALIDKRRFSVLDSFMTECAEICGDGVISGWNVFIEEGSIFVSHGCGIIDRFFVESEYYVKKKDDILDGELVILEKDNDLRIVAKDKEFVCEAKCGFIHAVRKNLNGYFPPVKDLEEFFSSIGEYPLRSSFKNSRELEKAKKDRGNIRDEFLKGYVWNKNPENLFNLVEFVFSDLEKVDNGIVVGKIVAEPEMSVDDSGVKKIYRFQSRKETEAKSRISNSTHSGNNDYDSEKISLDNKNKTGIAIDYYDNVVTYQIHDGYLVSSERNEFVLGGIAIPDDRVKYDDKKNQVEIRFKRDISGLFNTYSGRIGDFEFTKKSATVRQFLEDALVEYSTHHAPISLDLGDLYRRRAEIQNQMIDVGDTFVFNNGDINVNLTLLKKRSVLGLSISSLTIRRLDHIEVVGVLQDKNIEGFDAGKIKRGTIARDRLPELSHANISRAGEMSHSDLEDELFVASTGMPRGIFENFAATVDALSGAQEEEVVRNKSIEVIIGAAEEKTEVEEFYFEKPDCASSIIVDCSGSMEYSDTSGEIRKKIIREIANNTINNEDGVVDIIYCGAKKINARFDDNSLFGLEMPIIINLNNPERTLYSFKTSGDKPSNKSIYECDGMTFTVVGTNKDSVFCSSISGEIRSEVMVRSSGEGPLKMVFESFVKVMPSNCSFVSFGVSGLEKEAEYFIGKIEINGLEMAHPSVSIWQGASEIADVNLGGSAALKLSGANEIYNDKSKFGFNGSSLQLYMSSSIESQAVFFIELVNGARIEWDIDIHKRSDDLSVSWIGESFFFDVVCEDGDYLDNMAVNFDIDSPYCKPSDKKEPMVLVNNFYESLRIGQKEVIDGKVTINVPTIPYDDYYSSSNETVMPEKDHFINSPVQFVKGVAKASVDSFYPDIHSVDISGLPFKFFGNEYRVMANIVGKDSSFSSQYFDETDIIFLSPINMNPEYSVDNNSIKSGFWVEKDNKVSVKSTVFDKFTLCKGKTASIKVVSADISCLREIESHFVDRRRADLYRGHEDVMEELRHIDGCSFLEIHNDKIVIKNGVLDYNFVVAEPSVLLVFHSIPINSEYSFLMTDILVAKNPVNFGVPELSKVDGNLNVSVSVNNFSEKIIRGVANIYSKNDNFESTVAPISDGEISFKVNSDFVGNVEIQVIHDGVCGIDRMYIDTPALSGEKSAKEMSLKSNCEKIVMSSSSEFFEIPLSFNGVEDGTMVQFVLGPSQPIYSGHFLTMRIEARFKRDGLDEILATTVNVCCPFEGVPTVEAPIASLSSDIDAIMETTKNISNCGQGLICEAIALSCKRLLQYKEDNRINSLSSKIFLITDQHEYYKDIDTKKIDGVANQLRDDSSLSIVPICVG